MWRPGPGPAMSDDGLGRRSRIFGLIASDNSAKRAECFCNRDRGSSSTFRACFGVLGGLGPPVSSGPALNFVHSVNSENSVKSIKSVTFC